MVARGGAMDAGISHLVVQADVQERPFLAVDVGGTHARVALIRAAQEGAPDVDVLAYRKFSCAEFPGLAELLRTFLEHDACVPVRRCVLACAGQLLGDEVLHDNLAWPIHLSRLRNALAFDDVAILNDFEALGHALDGTLARSGQLLCGPDLHEEGPALVVGPGTGLGAAVHLPGPAGGRVLTTEAGQMDFAPNSIREREILACLAPHGGYVACERIISGPGLLTLYTTVCRLDGAAPRFATPEAVTAAALTGGDAQATQAVDLFCAALGSFVGGLAMVFMATGGVYLAGGFLYSMFGLLQRSAFEERFLHGRSVRAFLSRMPVRVVDHGRHGVLGAASWYARRVVAEDSSPPVVAPQGLAV